MHLLFTSYAKLSSRTRQKEAWYPGRRRRLAQDRHDGEFGRRFREQFSIKAGESLKYSTRLCIQMPLNFNGVSRYYGLFVPISAPS